ncbi:hypothetical protein [Streptomyces sp. NBC_01363]|uniref:hypothetical protein n=1 Tax=Streptomyces sp. NBC_01363 TaxID=2903840 RepID=UPI00225472A8|nr:hypothetical protein [Streptomyces sp. NBC_01363]MCX4731512.1 hypothetical protein [Streptomyces sp. NBC_01363]
MCSRKPCGARTGTPSSWLIVVCAAVTFAVTIGAVLAEEPPLNRFLTGDRGTREGTVDR